MNLLPLSLSLLVELAAGAYSQWHLVDVPSVVCDGTAEWPKVPVVVQMDLSTITPATSLTHPYILTFYRSSNPPVKISYNAINNNGAVVVAQNVVELSAVNGARRLEDEAATHSIENVEKASDSTDAVSDGAAQPTDVDSLLDEELEEAPVDRELKYRGGGGGGRSFGGGSRSRGGGWGSSRSRSRSSSMSSARRRGPAPRPAPKPKASPSTTSRRRTVAARRRGVKADYARRRGVSPSAPVKSNPANPSAGSYAYSSSKLQSNYGSAVPATTGYGYTGASAYKASSGMGTGTKVALALGGGALLGYGMSSMMHSNYYSPYAGYPPWSRWNTYGYGYGYSGWGESCYYGSTMYPGGCGSCYQMYGYGCYQQFNPPVDANRDDLTATGFIPADVRKPDGTVGYINVTITSVSGPNFMKTRLCPPPGFTLNNTMGWEPPNNTDLYLTLTELDEIDTEVVGGQPQPSQYQMAPAIMTILSTLFSLCCCCVCIAGIAVVVQMNKKKEKARDRLSSSSDSDFE